MIIHPGPSGWRLPDPRLAPPGEDVIGIGADLAPATLIAAYSAGLFPMHLSTGELAWWSPDPRGVLPLDGMRVTRSLRVSARRFTVTFDRSFEDVMRACSDDRPDERWITEDFIASYTTLHSMGWTHSVEVWREGALVGGLYGVEVGGLFAGESMFHRESDASKVALLALVERLKACGAGRLLDVQWRTNHLGTLGAIEIPRPDYLDRLAEVIEMAPCLSAGPVVSPEAW